MAQDATSSTPSSIFKNDPIGIEWKYPPDWTAQSVPPAGESGPRTVLISLSAGRDTTVDLTADETRRTIVSGQSLEDELKAEMLKQGLAPYGDHGYRTLGTGLAMVVYRFKSNTTPENAVGVMTGPLRGYEIEFIVKAPSAEKLEDTLQSIRNFTVRPDWSRPDPVPGNVNAGSTKMVRVSMGVSQAFRTKDVAPQYPSEARSRHIEGTVLMLMHLNKLGQVQDLYVISGDPLLARAAVTAVSQWEYRPYLLNNEPVAIETQVSVHFTLH